MMIKWDGVLSFDRWMYVEITSFFLRDRFSLVLLDSNHGFRECFSERVLSVDDASDLQLRTGSDHSYLSGQ